MALTKVTYAMIDALAANVRDYGASETATAAANNTAIQNAINALSSTGGTVVIDGYFEVTGDIVGKSNVNIVGLSQEHGLYLASGASTRIFDMRDASNWKIECLYLDHSGNTSPTAPIIEVGATVSAYSKNWVVRDCTLYNGSYEGIYQEDRSGTKTNALIDNVTFDSCRRNGIAVQSGENITIRNCSFIGTSGFTPQDGIDIEPDGSQSVKNLRIEGCYFSGNLGNAIAVNGAAWGAGIIIEDVTVIGNTIDNSGGSDAIVVGGAHNVNVIGNTITGDNSAQVAGINLTGDQVTAGNSPVYAVNVIGNTIKEQTWGIAVKTNVTASNIIGNNISIGGAESNRTGIRVSAGPDKCVLLNISENIIAANAGGYGISFYSETSNIENCAVRNNTISYVTTGLVVGQTAKVIGCQFVNNKVFNSSTYIDATYNAGTDTLITQMFANQAAAPSTGAWRVGDTVYNSAPAAGQPQGWVCTASGSPGTWKAMSNLA